MPNKSFNFYKQLTSFLADHYWRIRLFQRKTAVFLTTCFLLAIFFYGCQLFFNHPPSIPQYAIPTATFPGLTPMTRQNIPQLQALAQLGEGRIYHVAYSPDGRYLAAGTASGVIIFQADTLSRVEFIKTYITIDDIEFAPDSTILAVSFDGRVEFWQTSDWQTVRAITPGYQMSYAANGTLLAVNTGSQISIWSLQNSLPIESKALHIFQEESSFSAIAVSPDGSWVAAGTARFPFGYSGIDISKLGPKGHVFLWQLVDPKLNYSINAHNDDISELAFSPDSQTLAVAASTDKGSLWQVQTSEPIHFFQRQLKDRLVGGNMRSVSFSPDGTVIALANNGQVEFWSTDNGRLQQSLKGHNGRIQSVAFAPDGQTVASASINKFMGGGSGFIHVHQVDKNQPTLTYNTTAEPIDDVQFSPDGALLAASGWLEHSIWLWQVSDGQLWHKLTFDSTLSAFRFTQDGRYLIIDTKDDLLLWRLSDGKFKRLLRTQNKYIHISDDGRWIIIYTKPDTPIRIMEVVDEQLAATKQFDTQLSDAITAVFSPNGRFLATEGKNNQVNLWSVAEGNLLHVFPGTIIETLTLPVFSPQPFSQSGQLFQTMDQTGKRTIWDIRTGRPIKTSNDIAITNLILKDQVQISSTEEKFTFSDSTTNTLLHQFPPIHNNESFTIAVSPDNQLIATAALDGTIRLWGIPIKSTSQ